MPAGPFVGSKSVVTVPAGIWEWEGIKEMETEALSMFISSTLIINRCVERITLPRFAGMRHGAYLLAATMSATKILPR